MTAFTCDYQDCTEATNSNETDGWLEVRFSEPDGDGFKGQPLHFCSVAHLSKFKKKMNF